MTRQYKNGKCSCWDRVNKELEKFDTKLELLFTFTGFNYLIVSTCKSEEGGKRRAKPKTVVATYCPFCGEKLVSEDT